MSTKLFRFIQDLYDLHYITEEQLNKFKIHDFSKKEIKVLEQNYEIYKTSNEFDEINNAIKSTVNMINSFTESLKENELFSSNTPYEIKVNGKKIKSHSDYEVVYDRVENDEYVLGIKIKGVGNAQLRFSSKNEAKELGWITDESKKSARKSTKESKVDFQSVIDKVLPKEYAKNKNAYRYALSCVTSLYNEDEYDSDSAKVYFLNCYISDLFPSWVDELGEEEIDAFANALYDGTMKWSDIDSSWLESKKSTRNSLKKYLVKGLDVDFVVDHLLSLEDPNNFDLINELSDLWEVYNKSWSKFNKSLSDFWEVMKDIKKLNSFDKTCKEIIDAWCDDIEKIFYSDDNLENLKLNYGFEGNDVFEIKESAKKSLKESTDESFSLYDLNKHDPFVKEWIRNINKELRDVSIESIGDDEIVFRVWFDENIDLDIFDDIATDCMPSILIEFMSDMNIDFNYQFVYADDKFIKNDYVFIRFVAW